MKLKWWTLWLQPVDEKIIFGDKGIFTLPQLAPCETTVYFFNFTLCQGINAVQFHSV